MADQGLDQNRDVVRAGRRASALLSLLVNAGFRPAAEKVSAPRLDDLSPDHRRRLIDLYRVLGGTSASPRLRPGPWDLVFEGSLVVELDEELHFDRYRAATLEPAWTAALPWRHEYVRHCREREPECLAAAGWGARWTNPSCEQQFGRADPPGSFAVLGAPRWKQRALYDAIKDATALSSPELCLARIATVDVVDGVRLGDVLAGRARLEAAALRSFVVERSVVSRQE